MNTTPNTLVRAILTTLLLAVPAGVSAQALDYPYNVDTRPRRGFLTDAMTGAGVDAIDSVSGNLHLQIPIASLAPGPAGSGFTLALVYNSSIWQSRGKKVDVETEDMDHYDSLGTKLEVDIGWHYNFEGYRLDVEERTVLDRPPGQACLVRDGWRNRLRIGLPDGSLHTLYLRNELTAASEEWDEVLYGDGFMVHDESGLKSRFTCSMLADIPDDQRLTYYTADGSYLKLEITTDNAYGPRAEWILHYPDGRRVHGQGNKAKKIYDANGNWVEFDSGDCDFIRCTTTIRDQYPLAGGRTREIQIEHNRPGKFDVITVPTETSTATWNVNWRTVLVPQGITYEQNPDTDDLRDIYKNPSGNHQAVASIQPPGGIGLYNFYYDRDRNNMNNSEEPLWGELTRMTTPTGAIYDYWYQDDLDRASPYLLRNSVTVRKVTAGAEERTWTYAYTDESTTITGPDGGVTRMEYPDLYIPRWNSGRIRKITNPDGSIIERTWQQNKVPYISGSVNPNNPYVARERVTPSGMSLAVTVETDFTYDKNGNLLSRIEKHWNEIQARKLVQTFYHVAPADEDGTVSQLTDTAFGYWQPHAAPWTSDADPRRLNAVKRREIWGTGTTTLEAVSEFVYDDAFRNGNVEKEIRWDDTRAPSAATPLNESLSQVLVRAYHANGNLSSVSAPEIATSVTYGSLEALPGPYPTAVTYGSGNAQRSFTYTWNDQTGRLMSWTDADNSVTTTYTYDIFGRRTSANEAGKRKTVTAYDDQNLRVTEKRDLKGFDLGELQSVTHYDPLGRITRVRVTDGSALAPQNLNDGIKVLTDYATVAGGQRTITTTPFRQLTDPTDPMMESSDPTLEWTCVQQDLAGRTVAVGVFKESSPASSCTSSTNQTGRTVFAYNRNITRITEKAPAAIDSTPATEKDVVRVESRDALGQLLQVTEDPGGLNYTTSYRYDGLGNLTQVAQGSQVRTFVYSSLSRLISASNPESGTTHYVYDDAGNLLTRTDARSVTATYTYDDLHRPKTIAYSDTTPGVTYAYHTSAGASGTANVGRLQSIRTMTAPSDYVATSTYAYDTMGRVQSQSQTIAGHPDTFTFTNMYFLNDALKSQIYPSGRTVNYDVDNAGRVTKVAAGSRTYAGMTRMDGVVGDAYAPDGRLRQMKLGNNLWETRDYHTPGTTTLFKLGISPGNSERLELGYDYHATANNGNLTGHTITRTVTNQTTSWTQTFGYDGVNRLETASETNGYSRTFGYDRYGNRRVASNSGMTAADSHEPVANVFDPANNRMTNLGPTPYDAAGNQTRYSPYTLVYDAENRLASMTSTSSGSGTYLYDGYGRRVKKTWTPGGGAAQDTYYVYDIVGNLAAEYGTGSNADPGTPPATVYPFTDMLGSVRAVTDATGAVLECYDYLPFGRMLSSSDNGRSTSCHPSSPDTALDSETSQKFTGQIRDEETRLDYFGARYMSAPQGRFMSADPVAMSAGRLFDPQAINLYAYVRNNPLKYIDPLGEDLSFAGLSEEDNERLLEILEERSGLALNYTPDTGLVGIAGTRSGGSELFRDGLTRLIGSDQVFTVSNQSSYQGKPVNFGLYDPETQNIILDFNDAASVPELDLGLVFYHEGISHGLKGLLDEPRSYRDLTTILDTIAAARELGLHAPTGHDVMPDERGRYFIQLVRPFREPHTGLNRIRNWFGSGSTSIDLTDVYSNSN